MVTNIHIRNFKRLDDVEFELGKSVVLIGPNNSGKTTALQALALWDIGLRRWNEKWGGKQSPEKRPGVTINRRDLIAIPVPDANLLWRDLHVRSISRQTLGSRGSAAKDTKNVRIDIVVEGVTDGKAWKCGLEFDYANVESFYCRPLRLDDADPPARMKVPPEARDIRVAFLPPMSGLAEQEYIKQPGEIGVLIGQGQTAQVLRNLCYQIYTVHENGNGEVARPEWDELVSHINQLFGVTLLPPRYIHERGEIVMAYREARGIELDLSSSGRGLQQTLLLLAHLYANPNTILLLDEPDAHLEVIRQRQIYQLLTDVADKQGSQVIAASHSEVVLNEAADRDIVIAFVGKPHRIDDRGSQLLKSLKDIGFDQYYQAETAGWVLYLEGSTDLAILRAFARTLDHPATKYLEQPFVYYVGSNIPQKARDHFYGLREAKADLVGAAVFDRIDKIIQPSESLQETMWRMREIENYLCTESVLMRYATHDLPGNLFGNAEAQRREAVMRDAIREISTAIATLRKTDPWSPDVKASDDVLDPLFDLYFAKLELPNLLRKSDYHILASLVTTEEMDDEIAEKLDVIAEVAARATPRLN